MTVPFMRALVTHDQAAATRELGAAVPAGLADELEHFLQYRLAQVEVDPSILPWLGRAMILTDEAGVRRLIGTIGFHGAPDDQGRVEVGYRVEPAYRRQGFARESVLALFDWAATTHGIRRFIASISPTNFASLQLAAGFGFVQAGSHVDEIDGVELVFETTWPPVTARAVEPAGMRSAGGRGSAARRSDACG